MPEPETENHGAVEGAESGTDSASGASQLIGPAALAGRVAAFPHLPGIYIFRDAAGTVLYVGKARDLRKRIGNYFRNGDAVDVKTRIMLGKAADLEYALTSSEKEALLLEASLIKKYRPRYNVVLRDDKNYLSIRIDPRDPYPRLDIVRRFQKDGALYFGPYTSARAARDTLKYLHQLFPLRLCKGKKLVPRERPCLNFSMGQCLGPCAGKVSREDYMKMVEEVTLFLEGKTDVLQRQLKQRMQEAAEALHFELAAFYRDRLRNVAATIEKQHIVSDRFVDRDVLGICQEEERTELVVLFVRQGVHSGQRAFDLKEATGDKTELISAFIQQYYYQGGFVPDEVIVPVSLDSETVLSEWLSEMKGRRVRVWAAKRGDRKHLLDMAEANAREGLISRRRWQKRDTAIIDALKSLLRLPRSPERIACVDISNIQGQHAVGAVVVFEHGRPDKNSYRRYRIRLKSEPDDPAMMSEVIGRLMENDAELSSSLDLLLLDGGKGQLNTIVRLLEQIAPPEQLPVASIAKERESDIGDKGKGLYEKIYLPGRKNPLFLHRHPDILHLLQRIRDEAHRFAVTHYQNVHRTSLLTSALDSIAGIGPGRRQMLLQRFGSIDAIQEATVSELESAGLPRKVAQSVLGVLSEMESRAVLQGQEEESGPRESPL
ncbi:MAG: excinuclease ABC subunit UvrC [Deltaproteobacteria bacterium]|jgi:excinuclease ABC subunit C|nr:excinuclease ABC subunit UvrC [Deltaproteobacteria bacterium]MDA8307981.1 excinuclease ABC subunit UvrC [Deltaproteobacteria bacterium]